jgi:hypothetical protein
MIAMKDRIIIPLCLILSAAAGLSLLAARQNPAYGLVAPLFLGLAVFLILGAEKPSVPLLFISGVVTLTLSFRFTTLTWGDPWQDYESVIEVLTQGSTTLPGYRLQQPILPVLVGTISLASSVQPLLVQKIAIPLVSALSAPILYSLSRRYIDKRAALAGTVLFLAGIPYLHWASQGVRETIGIPFFLFALLFSIQILEEGRYNDILILIPILTGLILSHHQSAVFFVAILTAILLIRLYFISEPKNMKKLVLGGFIIIGGSMGIILLWWALRIPFIFTSFSITLTQLSLNRLSGPFLPLGIIAAVFALVMLAPILFPGVPGSLRSLVHAHERLIRRTVLLMQGAIVFITGLLGLIIMTGNFPFSVSYPPLMILALIGIVIAAVCGINRFFNRTQFYFIIWALLPGLMLMVGLLLTRIPDSQYGIQIDPLRFIGYLWPALAIIAGAAITGLKNRSLDRVAVTMLFILLLVTAFPPVVFTGQATDDRSLVISHPEGELMAIYWFKNQEITEPFSSDRYAIAPARWLNPLGYTIIIPQGRPGIWNGTSYWMVTDRMYQYANFDEWILKTPHPMNQTEIEKINSGMDCEYDNGYSRLYRIR